ncbi:MAG TPA: type VII secretion protein EssB [Cellulomonas sp.]
MSFVLEKDGETWTLPLRRSLLRIRDEAELDLIAHEQDTLMPCRLTWQEDQVTLHLTPGAGTVGWDDVVRRPRVDRLRALINIGETVRLLDRGYVVLLHPENLVVDRNLRPRLAYRGLLGTMPPLDFDAGQLLRQYQALVLSTVDPGTSFDELVDGALTLRRATGFERSVLAAGSIEELVACLAGQYETVAQGDAARLVRVSRRTHRVLRHAVVWLAVVAVAAGAATAYSVFVRTPFTDRMLAADTQFIRSDYDGVIETLRPVGVDDLPATQRYELAASYLRGTNLTEEQKAAVAGTLSLSSDTETLTYWIQVGRGDLDEALDTAKGLNEVDLVLYALTMLQEQVAQDTSLSGTKRQERLDELQSEYDTSLENRTAAVDGGAAATATDAPTADPATEPAEG